jgi:catechol 2,3-dioxygenase-like lactoylglutathione lyase family enzyme
VALSVRDVTESVDFYCSVFGMKIDWKPDENNVYLTSGSDNLAIHKRVEDELGPVQRVDHIGFFVSRAEDVDAMAQHVGALGISIVHPVKTHRDGSRSFYFKDPDGLMIQLLWHPSVR